MKFILKFACKFIVFHEFTADSEVPIMFTLVHELAVVAQLMATKITWFKSQNFLLWAFEKDAVSVSPASNSKELLKIWTIWIKQQVDTGMLSRIWIEVDYRWGIWCVMKWAHVHHLFTKKKMVLLSHFVSHSCL